ncbi:MAG: hypothetical protein MUE59_03780 [Thiobacillaceae bacterium]|jgi:hypothetical protein|nr:hypothetical protein [Thiobacillaceae bacterium]
MNAKITLQVIRHFAIGFEVLSPKFNGFCIAVNIGIFQLLFWNRGRGLFAFNNYWNQ